MAFSRSTLELVGADPSILNMHNELGLTLCCRPKEFETDGTQMHIVLLSILEQELPEPIGVARTMNWLNENREKLELFSGGIALEILCRLEVEDGSRYLRITAEAAELLFDLQCDLLFQYARTFSRDDVRTVEPDVGMSAG